MKIYHAIAIGLLGCFLSGCTKHPEIENQVADAKQDLISKTETSEVENKKSNEQVLVKNPANRCSSTIPMLCSQEPFSPDFSNLPNPVTLPALQHDFDVFSWNLFVAINWPAKANGTADTSVMIGEKSGAQTVWQSYKESRDIFLPDGAKPLAWGVANPAPKACGDTGGLPVLSQVGKTPNVLDESGEPFQTGPLIDQNGLYARFAILTNMQMFDYIVENKLYSKSGQVAFAGDADFPFSTDSQPGAIMIKSAWKIMGADDKPALFHTTKAFVYDNPHEYAGVKAACSLQTVGLVGLHMATKTQGDLQWTWSTFEHVDNVPTKGQTQAQNVHYNFYKPNCGDCTAVNTPPPRPWDPATPHTQPSQIERVIPIDAPTIALNTSYQTALKTAVPGSVWANYELVSTQWPTDPNSVSDPTGVPAPTFLANTTLESYIQGSIRQISSSCIQCHNNAAMTNGKFSDFTYLLQRAQ
ncbi:MAG: hypothetical protein JKX98_09150 [Alcanivoracaceae bacterium]|nr:hypothetical protein [Alcanivoracaceae bacterium]